MINKEILNNLFEYKDGFLFHKFKKNAVNAGDPAGNIDNLGYLKTSINKKTIRCHRIIFMMFHGYLPKIVDHIDGNKLNNRIENLRAATPSQNLFNSKKKSTNISGYKSVSWHKQRNKWQVRLQLNNKTKSFGLYDDIELADLVAQEARDLYHGKFAKHQ